MKYFAILKDSFLEVLDRKSFIVLGVLSLIFILLCWGISFSPLSSHEAIQESVKEFDSYAWTTGPGKFEHRYFVILAKVTDVEDIKEGPKSGGFAFTLTLEAPAEFHKAVTWHTARVAGKVKKGADPIPGEDPETKKVPVPDEKEQIAYLVNRCANAALGSKAEVTRVAEDVFSIRCKPERPQNLRGAYRMSVLFGLKSFSMGEVTVSFMVWILETMLAEWLAGFVGVIMALIFTGSFIPSMLEKGHIELLLSRPVNRVSLLIYKYLGGLLYVFLLAVVLIGGSWLALATRSGYWNATYLWSIAVLTYNFAILYSISVLFGVLWRSWIGSVVMTIVGWLGAWVVNSIYLRAHTPETLAKMDPGWLKVVDILYFIFPKVSHLGQLNTIMLAESHFEQLTESGMDVQEAALPGVTWEMAIFTSLGFIVVMLGLACWRFSRKDY